MILLNSDVTWFCPRPSNLVLLLKDNGCETSTSGGVAKNVSDIVVTKQQRRPMVTASCVISEHVHLCIASFSLVAACGARKRCVKKWHSQPKLQRCTKDVRLHAKAKTGNRGCKEPIACMRHRAGKEQIVRTRRRPSFEGIKQGGMAFGRKFLLDRFLITESRQRMNLSSDHFMSSQQRRHSQRFELISIHSEYRRN